MATAVDHGSTAGLGSGLAALIRKELSELALPALALVLGALILAGVDLLYGLNYPEYHGQGIAASIWLVLSFAIAFFGGAATIAREGRQRLIFLTSWPQSRAKLWLVKSLVSFLLTMGAIAAGFGFCLGALQLAPGVMPGMLEQSGRSLFWYLPFCFVLGLLWSGLVSSVLGAVALGFVTGCVLLVGDQFLFSLCLPTFWGPYVGDTPPAGVSLYAILAVLIAGAIVFLRLPVLEMRRRVPLGLGLLLGLALLGSAVHLGWSLASRTPSLDCGIYKAGLTPDGRQLYLATKGERDCLGGLWLVGLDGGGLRLVCRAGGTLVDAMVGALALYWAPSWAVTLPEGRPRRLHGEAMACSPDGRYGATAELLRGVVMRDGRDRIVAYLAGALRIVFSPDSRTAYYCRSRYPTSPEGTEGHLLALDLATGKTTELLRVRRELVPWSVSPDGQWLAVYGARERTLGRYSLLNLRTRRLVPLGDVSLLRDPFVTERYLWCYQRDPETHERLALSVVEVPTGRVANRLTGSSLQGEPGSPLSRPGVPYVIIEATPGGTPFSPDGARPPCKLWLAKPDGSGLRFLREEARPILGMSADGRIVLWDRPYLYKWDEAIAKDPRLGRRFVSWDPISGQEKTLFEVGASANP